MAQVYNKGVEEEVVQSSEGGEGDERIRCLFRALSPILGPLQQIKIISQTDS